MPHADLNDIALFVKVIDKGGFAKAARAAQLPTSTVSRAVARLEEALGARLIHRTTRSVSATEEGRSLYERAARPLGELEAAARGGELGRGQPRGTLRLTAPTDIGTAFLAEVIVEFSARHPAVSVDMVLSNRTLNLVEEGFDLAIRIADLADSSLAARKLAPNRRVVCASPSYLRRHGTPRTPDDLAQHNCLATDFTMHWDYRGPDGKPGSARVSGRYACDNWEVLREWALR